MPIPQQPFHTLDLTPGLVSSLISAAAAIGALNARISASSMTSAWKRRASWTGYAAALRLQKEAIEEVDVIAHLCGVSLPQRERLETTGEVFSEYGRWTDTVLDDGPRPALRGDAENVILDPATPTLLRALSAVDIAAREDGSIKPWLSLPAVLAELKLTSCPIPSLVVGDFGQRYAREPRLVVARRLLAQLAAISETGIERLNAMERARAVCVETIADVRRPGLLSKLGPLLMHEPAISPSRLSSAFGMTKAGAGRLLGRAAELGIVAEVSGRNTWKVYVARDVAQALGLLARDRGRPYKIDPYRHDLSGAFADFDSEMADIDRLLSKGKLAPFPLDQDC